MTVAMTIPIMSVTVMTSNVNYLSRTIVTINVLGGKSVSMAKYKLKRSSYGNKKQNLKNSYMNDYIIFTL